MEKTHGTGQGGEQDEGDEEEEEEEEDTKIGQAGSSTSPPVVAERTKVKRAKPKKKIKRTRHITSCWQCREKKQKVCVLASATLTGGAD